MVPGVEESWEVQESSRCRECALAAPVAKVAVKGAVALLREVAQPVASASSPKRALQSCWALVQSLSLITLNKSVQQLLKGKTKGFWVPCGHSLLWEDELLPGCATDGTALAQGSAQTQLSWHSQTTALEERGNGPLRPPCVPEALKCRGVILFFLSPD